MVYKLDKIDRRLLYELDKNCRVSDNQLAKKVNRSREAVRNRINKLMRDSVLVEFVTLVNHAKIGYLNFKLYAQLKGMPEERKRFFEYLKGLPGVFWFGINDGVWDYHMTTFSKDQHEFNRMKNRIYSEFKDLIVKRDTGLLTKTRIYPKKYLIYDENDLFEYYFAGEVEHFEITEIDKKILNVIVPNARMPLVGIAKKVDSTVDIVRSRMKKMKDAGLIVQYRTSINYKKIGYTMFKSFLFFESLDESTRHKMIEYSRENPHIIYLVEQISSWDFEIEIMAESYEQFTEVMDDIRFQFKDTLKNYEFCLMKEDVWDYGKRHIL